MAPTYRNFPVKYAIHVCTQSVFPAGKGILYVEYAMCLPHPMCVRSLTHSSGSSWASFSCRGYLPIEMGCPNSVGSECRYQALVASASGSTIPLRRWKSARLLERGTALTRSIEARARTATGSRMYMAVASLGNGVCCCSACAGVVGALHYTRRYCSSLACACMYSCTSTAVPKVRTVCCRT